RLTDGQGHVVDFRNTVIIMTSNVGAQDLMKGTTLGFSSGEGPAMDWDKVCERIREAVRHTFRPEFLNRIDEMVIFKPLGKAELLKIVDLMLKEVEKRLSEQGVHIVVSQAARELLLTEGFDPKFGARPLRRTVQRMVEDRLADELLEGTIKLGDVVYVDVEKSWRPVVTKLTVDASVVIASLLPDEPHRDPALRLLSQFLLDDLKLLTVPLLKYEVTNAVWRALKISR
ncbi:MAG: AAA family ATPase, partial [Candidatus Methanosuratus sp.]|nr:AAA family ATPase [Candidatus Methanosuratincola sp.]